jgi:hypothetical protein
VFVDRLDGLPATDGPSGSDEPFLAGQVDLNVVDPVLSLS